MIYALVRIDFFPQLETVNPQLCERIGRALQRASQECGLPERLARGGSFLYGDGQKSGLAPQRALDFSFRVSALLLQQGEELSGFNLLLADRPEAPGEEVGAALERTLLRVEGEERIWLEDGCRGLFADLVELAPQGEHWYLPRPVLKTAASGGALRAVWLRERVASRFADGLGLSLDRVRRDGVLLVVDPLEADRRLAMETLLERLAGSAGRQPIPRLTTLFRRRSGLHPFLNSLDPVLLEETPRWLTPVEQAVWAEMGGILPSLQQGGQGMCPDHLETEFYLAYHLYLLAYVRRMESKLVPAVFVAEGFDTWHPAALRALCLLLQDLSLHPAFLPVLVSARAELPPELQTLHLRRFTVRPMGRAEVQETVSTLYPGLEIPRPALAQIRRACGGRLVPLVHYLDYLRRMGKIVEQEGRFRWIPKAEKGIPFPANPYLAAWNLVESLPESDRLVLCAVYQTAGLLDAGQLVGFLETLDIRPEIARKTLRALRALGLVQGGEFLLPLYPRLGPRLRAWIGEEKLLAHLRGLWLSGRYTRPVLLFTYLLRHDRAAWALEILPRLLRRKLDELDLEGAELFLSGGRAGLERRLEPAGRRDLALILASFRLRRALLAGGSAGAQALAGELQRLLPESGAPDGAQNAASPWEAEGELQLAAWAGATGDPARALEWSKRALLAAQRLELPDVEKGACRMIGSIQLAEGRLAEALEYLGFAEGCGPDRLLDEIRTLGLQAVALFLQGNLTRAMRVVQRGAALAVAARRREWEVLLRFLRGRILFELGGYREAAKELQEDLTVASLYGLGQAGEMLSAWAARALGFGGEAAGAARLLERLEERPETLLFLAECGYLLGDEVMAAAALERALALAPKASPEPAAAGEATGERIDWADGFAAVEGRCAALWAGRGLRARLLGGFRALLRGPQGRDELQAITRGERLPEGDPHLHLYHYFYWKVLPVGAEPRAGRRGHGAQPGAEAPPAARRAHRGFHPALPVPAPELLERPDPEGRGPAQAHLATRGGEVSCSCPNRYTLPVGRGHHHARAAHPEKPAFHQDPAVLGPGAVVQVLLQDGQPLHPARQHPRFPAAQDEGGGVQLRQDPGATSPTCCSATATSSSTTTAPPGSPSASRRCARSTWR